MSNNNMQSQINILKSVIGEFAVVSFCGKKRKLYGYIVEVGIGSSTTERVFRSSEEVESFVILETEEVNFRIEVETIRSIQYKNMLYCPANAPLSIRQKYGNTLIKVSLGDDKINSLIHYDEDEFLKEENENVE